MLVVSYHVSEVSKSPKTSQSLFDISPLLASQADGWDPRFITPGSNRKLPWICDQGHRWEAVVKYRVAAGPVCSICSGRTLRIGTTDLATTHPALAAEAHGWDPQTVVAGSNKKMTWRCTLGHTYEAQVVKRSREGHGCPYCSRQRVDVGTTDLATTHPALAAEAHGWDPQTVVAGSEKVVTWQCPLGHHYRCAVDKRTIRGYRCPFCSGRRVLAGFNDLATKRPDLADDAFGWDPATVTAGSSRRLTWKCAKGHIWRAAPANRTGSLSTGCPVCSGRVPEVGVNDLATTHPELAAQGVGWDPTTVSMGSDRRVRWICDVGHSWIASISNRAIGETGCPTCSKTGFDPAKPGWLYLLRHEVLDLLQIGISNDPKTRLRTHERSGWETIDLRGSMDGQTTRDLETRLLRFLRASGARMANDNVTPKFDGWRESWLADSLRVRSLVELIEMERASDQPSN